LTYVAVSRGALLSDASISPAAKKSQESQESCDSAFAN
jgi:hypothetical protein